MRRSMLAGLGAVAVIAPGGLVIVEAAAKARGPGVAHVTAARWPLVGPGAHGERVRVIQDMLRARGLRVQVDGVYRKSTTSAVRAFQRRIRVAVDGRVSAGIWPKLVVTVKRGSSGDAVRALQHQMRYQYGDKSVAVNGVFGARTQAAVKVFQARRGLRVDGFVGVTTWKAVEGVSSGAGRPVGSLPLANPVLKIGGAAAAKWIAEKIGGGLISGIAGKGLNLVMAQLGLGDRTSAQLEELRAKLDEISVQLTQLQNTMNVALQEIEKTQYAVLARKFKDLRDTVLAAQGDFDEALGYAGQPDKQATIDRLISNVEDKVNKTGGLVDQVRVVPESIGPPDTLTPKTMYQALSNVITGSKKFYTWRDSDALDEVYQYMLYIQALQFDLIAQVRTAQGSSGDVIYERFGKPYLGDKASFQKFLDKQTPIPTMGALHDELGYELTQLPKGSVLDLPTGELWSIDVPGGAQHFELAPSGPGYPVCTTGYPPACLTDPHFSVGGTDTHENPPRAPRSPAALLADKLAAAGYGPADQWNLPSVSELASLLSGWTPSEGSAKAWLEKRSGSDPATCKPVTPGSGDATSDPKTCVWPAGYLWSDTWRSTDQQIDQQDVDSRSWFRARYYVYGWGFRFLSIDNGSQPECFLFTKKIDWSDLGGPDAPSYDFNPAGYSRDWPDTQGCGGTMMLVRKTTGQDRYYFPL